MKPVILLCSAFLSMSALAAQVPATFDERVAIAKAAEDDERFHPYPAQMVRGASRSLAGSMRRCWGKSQRPDVKSFVMVADIQPDGRPRNVAVSPGHAVSRCFAAAFTSGRYLAPPPYPGKDGFPVTMRVDGGG